MATDLALYPDKENTVDASNYNGIEVDVLYRDEDDASSDNGEVVKNDFNLHLRNPACTRRFSSYRSTFSIEKEDTWETIQLTWDEFTGHGPGASETLFDPSKLRRIGLLAIGKEMDVFLAVSEVRFY